MNQERRATLNIVTTMAVWGTLGPFVRGTGLPSDEVALYRALLAVALIGGYLLLRGRPISLRTVRSSLLPLVASGAAMGFNWILLFEAYRYTTVSVATLSYYFAPTLVTIASTVLFKEKLNALKIACFIGSTLGLALVVDPSGAGAGTSHLTGVAFGLGAAVLYACVTLINKSISDVDGIERTVLQFVAAIVVLVPYVAVNGGADPFVMDAGGWACLLVLGIVHTGIAYCLYFPSLSKIAGQKAAILSYIDPLVAMAVSVAVLGEPIGALQLVGAALILGCTLANELARRPE